MFKIIITKNVQENNKITSWQKIRARYQQQDDSSYPTALAASAETATATAAATAATAAATAATAAATAATTAATAATAAATAAAAAPAAATAAVTSSPSSSWGQRRQHSGFAPPLVPL